ncbi:MAG: hypothetical protein HND55_06520 [Pseudomonadota bacterium]|nr:MAG: hypothetical protein HND55_06520 [Pseudomonadota bacterium]
MNCALLRIASLLRALAAIAIVGLIAACASPGIPHSTHPECNFRGAPDGVTPRGDGSYLFPPDGRSMVPLPLSTVSLTDYTLRNRMLVQQVQGRRDTSGNLSVFVRYVNCTDYPMIVESRTQFLDAQQAPSEPVTGWKRTVMPPKSLGNYQEVSVRQPPPHNFIVEVREQS